MDCALPVICCGTCDGIYLQLSDNNILIRVDFYDYKKLIEISLVYTNFYTENNLLWK